MASTIDTTSLFHQKGFPAYTPSHLATLWSSYGHIYRLRTCTSQNLAMFPTSLILKVISPPVESRATTTSESYLRKLISYRVERYFYIHLSHQLSNQAAVAKSYPVDPKFQDENLILEDLAVNYSLPAPHSVSSPTQISAVLIWLANFHATFWGCTGNGLKPVPTLDTPLIVVDPHKAEGVWRQGGYWYLDTRNEEMESMREDGRYSYLLPYFGLAAEKIKDPHGKGRTFIHGDCKAANIVFTSDGKKCALYDFQYFGQGLGVQDLVYFLATSVGRKEIVEEKALLECYYKELVEALKRRGVGAEEYGEYTWEVMLEQWEWALVDWMRFMAGWGFWGNAGWVEGKVKKITSKWKETKSMRC